MTLDDIAKQIDELRGEVRIANDGVASLQPLKGSLAALEAKMDAGFKDSKIRDEELRGLMKLGLEANEILREEMNRRFDATDQKNDEQISLLKAATRHNVTNR